MYDRSKKWSKVPINLDPKVASHVRKKKVYLWLDKNCKGLFQMVPDGIKFENDTDATYFGIGFK